MGFILDDLCVFLGVFVLWIMRGCQSSLWRELKSVEAGQFFQRREGVIGLLVLIAFIAAVWWLSKLS